MPPRQIPPAYCHCFTQVFYLVTTAVISDSLVQNFGYENLLIGLSIAFFPPTEFLLDRQTADPVLWLGAGSTSGVDSDQTAHLGSDAFGMGQKLRYRCQVWSLLKPIWFTFYF